MKPNFALNFTDTSIALLHRTAKGWLKVGDTPFDAPDLDEALDYLRKTALGLEPGGFTTKLVIPNSQILYAEIEAPGPDEGVRRAQISAALEGLTPYKAEEIVFDWSGRGRRVKVAAVALETLSEAEAFAVTHRFNPIGFVAIPETGSFSGEPWFGTTEASATLLSGADTFERDQNAISLLGESTRKPRRQPAAAAVAEAAAADAPSADVAPQAVDATPADHPASAVDMAGAAHADPAPEAGFAEDLTNSAAHTSEAAADTPAYAAAASSEWEAADAESITAAEPPVEAIAEELLAEAAPEAEAPLDAGDRIDTPDDAYIRDAAEPELQAPRHSQQELRFDAEPAADLGDDSASAGTTDAAEAVPNTAGPALSISGVHATRMAPPVRAEPAPPVSAPAAADHTASGPVPSLLAAPAERRAPRAAAPTTDFTAVRPDPDDAEEAPFAHVPDLDPDRDDEALNLRRRPVGRLADRFADRMAKNGRGADLPPALRADEGEEALPPPAPGPIAAARAAAGRWVAPAGREGAAATQASPTRAAPPLASAAPPLSAHPAAPRVDARPAPATAAAAAARGKPIEDLPPLKAATPAAPAAKTRANVSAAVAAPSKAALSLGRKSTAKISANADQMPPPEEAALSLGRSPFADRNLQRGKPRHLGLILIAILVLCLALVAAWSSIYLASGSTEQPAARVASADGTEAETEAEDGMDPEAFADGFDAEAEEPGLTTDAPELTAQDRTGPDPSAPDQAALQSTGPASVALGDDQDEIFLSAADAPPPAFDALALPSPDAAAEALPETPMPPPPFGMVYQFDDQGLIVPQAGGIPSPDGYTLFTGKPKRVPPSRPAAVETAAAAAAAATIAAEQAAAAATAAAAAAAAAPVAAPDPSANAAAGNPSLVEATPLTDAPATDAANGIAAASIGSEAEAHPAQQPNPELVDRRPRSRPAALEPPTADDDAALGTEQSDAPQFAGIRPRARSAAVSQAAAAVAEVEAEAVQVAAAASATASAATAAAEAGNPSLLSISRRPESRPKDFSRAVEAAVAAAVRAPEVRPEPTPEPTPEPVIVKTAAKSAAQPVIKPDEEDEVNEPELAAAAPAPKIPTRASVAKNATFTKAINLSKINLIGVYGSQSKRYALIRQTNGKYKKVQVGDKVDGGQIKAITQTEVRYQKGGRLLALQMPKG